MIRKLLIGLACATTLLAPAHAWWDDAWSTRARVVLDTSDKGLTLPGAVADVVLPVRLHSGNFDFASAQPDGSDLRVVGADDKTPLAFEIERFDAINELGVLWVRVPAVQPGVADKNLIHVYGGNSKAPAATPQPVFNNGFAAAWHFSEAEGPSKDAAAAAQTEATPLRDANGLLGGALRLSGTALNLPAAASLKLGPTAALTLALWAKPDAGAADATLATLGALQLTRTADKVELRAGSQVLASAAMPAAAWTQLVVSVNAGQATLYVNGQPAGQGALALADGPAALQLGGGFSGLVDEVQLLPAARDAAWARLGHAAQGIDGGLVRASRDSAGETEGGEPGYMGILLKNLTTDAWIVIIILLVMFAISAWVMVTKAMMLKRIGSANDRFLERFRADLSGSQLKQTGDLEHSTLFKLYSIGQVEVTKRWDAGHSELSGAALDAIKATMDAVQVRQNHSINARMVLLTIAISGGPFLGLLGTVVGVMITFAAIAAAGDVNVNAIAPGIAAALLATVAGLGVAIPALFGYNWLASQIKNISADMQIFVDEFITRAAEAHGRS